MVDDLFSENINLFLECPNAVHKVHINTEKFIPNPLYIGSTYLEMYRFVGKLMGMSIRVKLNLPFELPSIVWKKIVGIFSPLF